MRPIRGHAACKMASTVARADQRRATEMDVAVQFLNRMLELGRPESVRIA